MPVNKKNLAIEFALEVQRMFLADKCRFFEQWNEFLMEKLNQGKMIVLERDCYNMFYELVDQTNGDLANFVDDGTWPPLFDEFIARYK